MLLTGVVADGSESRAHDLSGVIDCDGAAGMAWARVRIEIDDFAGRRPYNCMVLAGRDGAVPDNFAGVVHGCGAASEAAGSERAEIDHAAGGGPGEGMRLPGRRRAGADNLPEVVQGRCPADVPPRVPRLTMPPPGVHENARPPDGVALEPTT